jgi:proline iminopeptidase
MRCLEKPYYVHPMMERWYWTEHGTGEPTLLLHGGMGLDHSYLRSCDSLGDSRRLIYLDQIGNGRSAEPTSWQNWSYASWAADLESFRKHIGLEQWTVVAHSGGAFVALEYALAFPGRLSGLVVVGGGPSFSHVEIIEDNIRHRASHERSQRVLHLLSTPATDDHSLAEQWREVLPLYFSQWEPRYSSWFEHIRYRARAVNAARPPDLRARLGKITAPTLVVCGNDDFIMPPHAAAEPLAHAIPGAELAILEHSGHFPMIERPREFHEAVRAFLGRC